MKRVHKALFVFVGSTVGLVLAAVIAGDPDQSPSDFREIGYYRSDSNTQIFAIAYSKNKNETNIIHHAKQLGYAD